MLLKALFNILIFITNTVIKSPAPELAMPSPNHSFQKNSQKTWEQQIRTRLPCGKKAAPKTLVKMGLLQKPAREESDEEQEENKTSMNSLKTTVKQLLWGQKKDRERRKT